MWVDKKTQHTLRKLQNGTQTERDTHAHSRTLTLTSTRLLEMCDQRILLLFSVFVQFKMSSQCIWVSMWMQCYACMRVCVCPVICTVFTAVVVAAISPLYICLTSFSKYNAKIWKYTYSYHTYTILYCTIQWYYIPCHKNIIKFPATRMHAGQKHIMFICE